MKHKVFLRFSYRQDHVLNPHGSDETSHRFQGQRETPMFLTHTVQMKPESGQTGGRRKSSS